MAKAPAVGGEVDSWCTKCKLDLNHRIIAMDGEKPKRVECMTCKGHHNYRRPKSAEPVKKKARAKTTRTSARARVTAAAAAKATQNKMWEDAIVGRAATDFAVYGMSGYFEAGQLIRHKKFGDGVVAELIEGGKISILFEEGPKTLVHGR